MICFLNWKNSTFLCLDAPKSHNCLSLTLSHVKILLQNDAYQLKQTIMCAICDWSPAWPCISFCLTTTLPNEAVFLTVMYCEKPVKDGEGLLCMGRGGAVWGRFYKNIPHELINIGWREGVEGVGWLIFCCDKCEQGSQAKFGKDILSKSEKSLSDVPQRIQIEFQ